MKKKFYIVSMTGLVTGETKIFEFSEFERRQDFIDIISMSEYQTHIIDTSEIEVDEGELQ